MEKKYNVILCGVQGYVGQVLMKLVLAHPFLHLQGVCARLPSEQLYEDMPILWEHRVPVYSFEDLAQLALADVLLLATPPDVSMEIVVYNAEKPIHIIDLSGAFRLKETEFTSWYEMPHTAVKFLSRATYGLSPWAHGETSAYSLIANPGCYASCALMALMPLFKENMLREDSVIIDAKSGASGAGKGLHEERMFCELAHNFYPYKVGKHQHTPEINKVLQDFLGKKTNVRLTTHMLPLVQGISMSIYAEPTESFDSDAALLQAMQWAFEKAYADYPLVRFAAVGTNPVADHALLSLKRVVGTPNTHIGYHVENGNITLFSNIDNLWKGAASQAIENINRLYQLPVSTGLKGAI